MQVGYARVSSLGQSAEIQIDALKAAGCDKLFAETMSARSSANRDQLSQALDFVREGDVFCVTRLDRLARSTADLHSIVERLIGKGVLFRCLLQEGVDTTTATGRLMLATLGAMAAFENDLRWERQREGIERAKSRGVYKGRPASIDPAHVLKLRSAGLGPSDIARSLNISRASVYRALAA